MENQGEMEGTEKMESTEKTTRLVPKRGGVMARICKKIKKPFEDAPQTSPGTLPIKDKSKSSCCLF